MYTFHLLSIIIFNNHSSDYSPLLLLYNSLRMFILMLVTAMFSFSYSIIMSARRPERANRMDEVIGERFSSLKVTRVNALSYFRKTSNDLLVLSWKMLLRIKQPSCACFSLEPNPWQSIANSLSMNLKLFRQIIFTFSDLSVRYANISRMD